MQETGCGREHCKFLSEGKLCISEVRMFRELPPDIQKELAGKAIHSTHEAGSYIASENDEIRSVIIIRTGKVKISRTDAMGEEHILDVLHDGQSVWHGIFLKDHYYNYDVICMGKVEICEIPRSAIMKALTQNPQISLSLIEILAQDIMDAEEKVMLLSIREPKQRVATFLLRRDRRCLGTEIQLKLEDIASSVNLRAETVSRNIAQLEKEGIIQRTGRGRLKVINREKLRELTEFNDSFA
ncbi:MAG: Crp/Fnr family transcriptional regulator [Eubacterium sp.]